MTTDWTREEIAALQATPVEPLTEQQQRDIDCGIRPMAETLRGVARAFRGDLTDAAWNNIQSGACAIENALEIIEALRAKRAASALALIELRERIANLLDAAEGCENCYEHAKPVRALLTAAKEPTS